MTKRNYIHIILLLYLLSIGLLCVGQKVKCKSVTIGEKIELPGVLNYLQPSQIFAVEMPSELVFYKKGGKGGEVSVAPMTYYAKVKASLKKGNEPADYTFKITTPGICILDSLVGEKYTNGYFGGINYAFPGSLEVCNKEGKVIRQFVLRDKNVLLHTTYHPSFLADQSQASMFDQKTVTGFASEAALLKSFGKDKNEVYARIEATELNGLAELAQEIMAFGYGTYVWPYKFIYMELDKKVQELYPELSQQIKEYSQTLEAYIADPGNEIYPDKFTGYGDFFVNQLNGEMPEGLVTCCAFNAICCYCIAEDLEKADSLFRNYKKSFGFFVAPRLDDLGYGYSARKALRTQDEVIYYEKALSFSERIKLEEETKAKIEREKKLAAQNEAYRVKLERLEKRNINKVEGYVVDKEGNTYEGKLVAQFTEYGASGIVNTSIGKHVMVYPREGKVRGFGPGKLQYFVTDSIYFFPLKEYNPGVIKAAGVLGGSMSRIFYERVYETEHYTLYYDRTDTRREAYLISKKGSEEGVPFVWIRLLNANVISRLDICEALQARIKLKEFAKDDVDTMKLFMDALENCQ